MLVAGVCLRKNHNDKKRNTISEDRGVSACFVGRDVDTAAIDAPPQEADSLTRFGDYDVLSSVLGAAVHLAQHSQFPGVSKAAMLVSSLANVISTDRNSTAEKNARLKRCRPLITMLHRAATVLGKVRFSSDAGAFQVAVPGIPAIVDVNSGTEEDRTIRQG